MVSAKGTGQRMIDPHLRGIAHRQARAADPPEQVDVLVEGVILRIEQASHRRPALFDGVPA